MRLHRAFLTSIQLPHFRARKSCPNLRLQIQNRLISARLHLSLCTASTKLPETRKCEIWTMRDTALVLPEMTVRDPEICLIKIPRSERPSSLNVNRKVGFCNTRIRCRLLIRTNYPRITRARLLKTWVVRFPILILRQLGPLRTYHLILRKITMILNKNSYKRRSIIVLSQT